MTTEEIKNIIENKLGKTTKAIINSDDNIHFHAIIISDTFQNILSKVEQQKMVYNIINTYIKSGQIHAFAMKTYTHNQWSLIKK